MELDSNRTDILNVELSVFKFNSISINGERNRPKPILAFKSWESWLIPKFNPSKKSLERFIKLPKSILRATIIKLSNVFVKAADFFKKTCLFVVADRFMPLFPANNSMFKSAVVEKTSRINKLVKLCLLSFVCEQPIFEGQSHSCFPKYSSIALRTSSATFNPVLAESCFKNFICFSVKCIFIRFIQLLYTPFLACQARKRKNRRFLCHLKMALLSSTTYGIVGIE